MKHWRRWTTEISSSTASLPPPTGVEGPKKAKRAASSSLESLNALDTPLPMDSQLIQQRLHAYTESLHRERRVLQALKQMDAQYKLEANRQVMERRRRQNKKGGWVSPSDFVSVQLQQPQLFQQENPNDESSTCKQLQEQMRVAERRVEVFRKVVQRLKAHAEGLEKTLNLKKDEDELSRAQDRPEMNNSPKTTLAMEVKTCLEETLDGSSMSSLRRSTTLLSKSSSSTLSNPLSLLQHQQPFQQHRVLSDEFEIKQRLGRGHFSEVFEAKHKRSGLVVAIKQCRLTLAYTRLFLNEVQIMTALCSPFCVRSFGWYWSTPPPGESMLVSLVLEHCEYDSIGNYILMNTLSEIQLASICQQVLYGLRFLHAQHIVHHDVKATNILLCRRGRIKLGDFGLSRIIRDQPPSPLNPFKPLDNNGDHPVGGSPYWMAPETLDGSVLLPSYPVDIWALGITLIEMAETFPPYFQTDIPAAAMYKIVNEPPPRLKSPNVFSAEMHAFLEQCLVKEWSQRPLAEQLLKHRFVREAERPFVAMSPVMETIQRRRSKEKTKVESQQRRQSEDTTTIRTSPQRQTSKGLFSI